MQEIKTLLKPNIRKLKQAILIPLFVWGIIYFLTNKNNCEAIRCFPFKCFGTYLNIFGSGCCGCRLIEFIPFIIEILFLLGFFIASYLGQSFKTNLVMIFYIGFIFIFYGTQY